MSEKRRRRIPLMPSPEVSVKPEKQSEGEEAQGENISEETPQPGELTQEKEDRKDGNIGKNNAGGYE